MSVLISSMTYVLVRPTPSTIRYSYDFKISLTFRFIHAKPDINAIFDLSLYFMVLFVVIMHG